MRNSQDRGGSGREVGTISGRTLGNGCLLLAFVIGLLSSATPWLFKLIVLAGAFLVYRLVRMRRMASADANQFLQPEPAGGAIAPTSFGRRRPGASATASPPAILHPAMEQELSRLDLYQRGLGAAASRYVANGQDDNLPDALEAIVKAAPRFQTPYHKDHAGKGQAQEAFNLALMQGAIPPGPEAARFLQIRLIADRPVYASNVSLTPAQELAQAAFTAVRAALYKVSLANNYAKPWGEAVSLRQMFELVRCGGGTVTDLFANLLQSEDVGFLTKDSWYESAECGELIRTYPLAFATALPSVNPKFRVAAVKLVEHHDCVKLPEIQTALVAMLGKPYTPEEWTAATSALARLDAGILRELIEREMPAADIDRRHALVQVAGRNNSPELLDLLQERAKVEKAAKVKAAISSVLESRDQGVAEGADGAGAAGQYVAVTGETIVLPPVPADLLASPGTEMRATLDALIKVFNAGRAAELAKGGARQQSQIDRLQPVSAADIESIFAWLRGEAAPDPQLQMGLSNDLCRKHQWPQIMEILEAAPPNVAIRLATKLGGTSVASVAAPEYYYRDCAARQFLRQRVEAGFDLRAIAGKDDGVSLRQMLKSDSRGYIEKQWRNPLEAFPRDAVWPWIVENGAVLDEALGLAPMKEPVGVKQALSMLALLPAVPQRYYARIVEIAVTEKRPLRREAMALLRNAKDLDQRLAALLDDARQPVRINAATWMADIRVPNAEAALRKRLSKEKSDPVRTALIEALQRLNADLSDVISPASLIAESQKAAAKGAPQLPDWLPVSTLPHALFRDRTPVPPELLRHWLAMAIRLKDPSATGQFGIYLDQLEPESARALSNWVLDHWITYDTHSPTLDEANAYAAKHAEATWQSQRRYRPDQSYEQVFDQMRRGWLAQMPNSGSDTKGMLALACRADPVWAAQKVRWFLKKHGRRSNQAMALLELLAGMNSPVALQVVIAASVRLKQKSTQKHAAELAERYAEDRGWSVHELADRTVPTAGFDDDGVLDLPCGEDEKAYTARLDAKLDIHLFNPDDKPVKALPAGDDEASKESKAALTTAKKELKQVVEMQTARLYEAMCVERSWPVADWRSSFHQHPLMRRLVERLVWQGLDQEGSPLGLFRPTQEGDFTDATDKAVDIDQFDRLRLAHGALLDAPECEAWSKHLKDYEVDPLIAQFGTTRVPLSAEQGETSMIEDRLGWVADSLTYRGIAEKRGYERVMGDGGGCNEYEKSFPSHGMTATIHHSGSYAVDENNPVALKGLSFRKVGQYSPVKLKEVPPVMLAECWADFHALAAKGTFDPDWEKKAAW